MMIANGFLDRRQSRAASLGLVVLLHAGVISAVVLIKVQQWSRDVDRPIETVFQPLPVPPPPPPPPPEAQQPVNQPISRIETPPRIVDTPVPMPQVDGTPTQIPTPPITPFQAPQTPDPTPIRMAEVIPPRPIVNPVRVEAQFASGSELQPPYPADEQRAEREGQVRVRVVIGTNGRVTAAEKLSATSDSFWHATERQALSRWRFRPATLDGRPVESSKILTVHFRIGT
jgi:periplasmic protein TonB